MDITLPSTFGDWAIVCTVVTVGVLRLVYLSPSRLYRWSLRSTSRLPERSDE